MLRIYAAHAEESPANDGNVLPKEFKKMENGSIIAVQDDHLRIQCGTGTLAVTQVQRPGRRAMSVRDFAHSLNLAGHRLG